VCVSEWVDGVARLCVEGYSIGGFCVDRYESNVIGRCMMGYRVEEYCAEISTLGGCCVKGVQCERMLCGGVQVGRMKSCLMGDVLTSTV
jgi:hypothetical protein